MKNYLSFGGGVNSVAMMLLLLNEGVQFEAVYVWMPDWPETHEYLLMLESKGYPITVISPAVKRRNEIWSNLYDYAIAAKIMPSRQQRWCTYLFKLESIFAYYKKPCFNLVGIDYGEKHRAKIINNGKGIENRYPLIEYEIDRRGCKKIITDHGLPLPPKSGCWFCPFQKNSEFRSLRRKHPDLFCKAVEMEKNFNKRREAEGKKKHFIKGVPLSEVIGNKDFLFEELAYPPCQCEL